VPDTDSDSDGTPDCNDGCPNDSAKTEPGDCGCGTPDEDSDKDGIFDCNDPCPNWPYECSEDGTAITVAVGQSIQQAIDAVPDGGTVQLTAGTYTQGSIDPGGRAIRIQGAIGLSGTLLTTIDAEGVGSVVVFQSGEGLDTQLRDLVLTGGAATYGGGIECSNGSSPTIFGCLVTGNTATEYGGGINCYDGSDPLIDSCTIRDNTATLAGGGISIDESAPVIQGCLIEANDAPEGGGLYAVNAASTSVESSIICGNTVDQVAGAFTGLGDNCIVDSCEDTDDNGIPDECEACVGDVNGDGQVNGFDLGLLLAAWTGSNDCANEFCLAADFNGDGHVDGLDMGLFLAAWGNVCP
jgi:parallel beta-helix repeat protein